MTDKQDTPRTDAEHDRLILSVASFQAMTDHARQLERELTALRASIEAAEMPEFAPGIRRSLERDLHDAEHPVGMSTHDGRARVNASHVRNLMNHYYALRAQLAAVTVERTALNPRQPCKVYGCQQSALWAIGEQQRQRATEAEAKLAAERDKALEDAAKVCESQGRASQSIHGNSFYIALGQAARAIRDLKSTNVHLK